MSRLSIETRLNLLIAALLVLALAANMAVILLSAGPRIKAENASVVKLVRQSVEKAMADMQGSANPQRDLAGLVERLQGLRHVYVFLDGGAVVTNAGSRADGGRLPSAPAPARATGAGAATDTVAWLARVLPVMTAPERVPAVVGGVTYGTIVMLADPSDEIAEISQALRDTAAGGLLLICAVFALTRLAVRQALVPIGALSSALSEMQSGNFTVRMPAFSTPEFDRIGGQVNTLASALTDTREENRRLASELISIEDQERRELARELHDELGPYLFAIRANATQMLAEAATDERPAGNARRRSCQAVLDHVTAVQQLNRNVLQRLRPPALAEIGLKGALDGMVAMWRENNPHVTIETAITLPDRFVDDPTQLTVYRVVQEGLTNAFRHAAASRVRIEIAQAGHDKLCVSVRDNGTGTDGDIKPGFGLTGMRDRVWALGGKMSVVKAAPEGGLVIAVELPLHTDTGSSLQSEVEGAARFGSPAVAN